MCQMKNITVAHVWIWTRVRWKLVSYATCQYGHIYDEILYRTQRVNTDSLHIKFCTVGDVSICTLFRWKFVQYAMCQYTQVLEKLFCSVPRVNIDTYEIIICKVRHMAILTPVRWTFVHNETCQYGNVSDVNLYCIHISNRHVSTENMYYRRLHRSMPTLVKNICRGDHLSI